MSGQKTICDWESYRERMATETDGALAMAIGCSIGTVRDKRREMGIKKALPDKSGTWAARFDDSPGMSDSDIAKKYGAGTATVERWRKRLGVASCNRHRTPDIAELLCGIEWGMRTDIEVAAAAGCSSGAVRNYRRDHDLPSAGNRKRMARMVRLKRHDDDTEYTSYGPTALAQTGFRSTVAEMPVVQRLLELGCSVLGKGWPDYLCVAPDGTVFAVEVKGDNDKLMPQQFEVITVLRCAGIPVEIAQPADMASWVPAPLR